MFKRFLHELVLLALLASLWGLAPALPVAAQPAQAGISPGTLLNPDGTLKLDGSTRGALDLSGYSVQIDPRLGPLFTPLAAQTNWAAIGEGGGPFRDKIESVVVNGTDIYVGGWFQDAAGIPEADYIARWDGSQWLALAHDGSGDGAINNTVASMLYSGGILYVAGWFGTVQNTSGVTIGNAARLARWDGSAWSAVPGISANLNDAVNALAFDTPNNILYVGGNITNVNGDSTADRAFGIDLDDNSLVTFGSNGASDGSINNSVQAMAVNSSGEVYVGGFFTDVMNGATPLLAGDYLAKWDGVKWANLGTRVGGLGALNSSVAVITVDGTDVYAGGTFTDVANITAADYIAKWNGSAWSALGDNGSGNGAFTMGSGGYPVQEIIVSGTDVYAGGYFNGTSGIPTADYVARFDTNTGDWYGLGDDGAGDASLSNGVAGMALSGGSLYVGGNFYDVSNSGTLLPTADYFAVFSSGSWSTLGDPDGIFTSSVSAMAVVGTDVYVGGYFSDAGGDPRMSYLARWDGAAWHSVGNSTVGYSSVGGYVLALAVDGTDLYVGGTFAQVYNEGVAVPGSAYIAKWNGSAWSALGSGLSSTVRTLAVDASHNVYAGGLFLNAGTIAEADYIAKWDGANWNALAGNGSSNGALDGTVLAIGVSGSTLYVGGSFTSILDTSNTPIANTSNLGKWNGSVWSAMDGITQPINNAVHVVAVSGADVYVGGVFSNLNGIDAADKIAHWNGSAWSALGHNGSAGGSLNNVVYAIVLDGTDVYAGGAFNNVVNSDGVIQTAADYAARWDGSRWWALGSNGASGGSLSSQVLSLLMVSNDLWAAGYFKNVNNNGTPIIKADYLAAYGKDLPPQVVSSLCATTCATTSALSVDFTVIFSEPVLDVDTADFVLTPTGTVSAPSVTLVSGTGATRTVTVSTGTGSGTLRLDIPDTATINDESGHALGGLPYTSGDVYTVVKKLIIRSTGAQDGWILESGEATNAGGTMDSAATTLRLGDDAARKQYRSILSFATGANLPDNAVITKVTLKVKRQGVVGSADPVSLFQGFKVDIKKGFFGTAALELTDWGATAGKTLGPFNVAPASGWYTLNLTPGSAFINRLATGGGLTQIRLRFTLDDDNNATADYLSLFSGNYSTVTPRPKLIIEFYTP